jgi:hypothetical protein
LVEPSSLAKGLEKQRNVQRQRDYPDNKGHYEGNSKGRRSVVKRHLICKQARDGDKDAPKGADYRYVNADQQRAVRDSFETRQLQRLRGTRKDFDRTLKFVRGKCDSHSAPSVKTIKNGKLTLSSGWQQPFSRLTGTSIGNNLESLRAQPRPRPDQGFPKRRDATGAASPHLASAMPALAGSNPDVWRVKFRGWAPCSCSLRASSRSNPQKWKTPVGSGRFPVVNLGVVGVFYYPRSDFGGLVKSYVNSVNSSVSGRPRLPSW